MKAEKMNRISQGVQKTVDRLYLSERISGKVDRLRKTFFIQLRGLRIP